MEGLPIPTIAPYSTSFCANFNQLLATKLIVTNCRRLHDSDIFCFRPMLQLTPELNDKFEKFRESYEMALLWLADSSGSPEYKANSALDTARRSVNASDIEAAVFLKIMNEEIPRPE